MATPSPDAPFAETQGYDAPPESLVRPCRAEAAAADLEHDRFPAQQRYHDELIAQLAVELLRGFTSASVYVNPGKSRMFEIAGLCPDLVLDFGANANTRFHLYEVETWDSVCPSHAPEWKAQAGLGYPLTVVVPEDSRDEAIELLVNLGLADVDVLTYRMRVSGKARFQ